MLKTDVSSKAIGAVLEQVYNRQVQPIAYFSKKLTQSQINYSAYGRELLVMYEVTKNFQHLIEGRKLTIFTDQKPLTLFVKGPIKLRRDKYANWKFLSQFVKDIKHIADRDNTVADTLSRFEASEMPVIVSTREFAEEQRADAKLQTLL